MPDNTRPRIVPGLDALSSVTATPPINPNDDATLQLIQQLLNPAPAPIAPAPTVMDKVNTVIGALANGISIGTSSDPGAALQNQIRQQNQQKFAAEQAQRDRDERLNMMNRQFGLQLLGNQVQEQSDIRKEKRVQRYKREDEKLREEAEIRSFAREKVGKEELINLQHDKALQLARFNNLWEADKQQLGQEFQERMTKLKENNDLLFKKVDLGLSFWFKGMPVGQAKRISDKILAGEELSKEEDKAMSRVIQLQESKERRIAAGGGRGGGGSSNDFMKDAWKMAQEFAKNPPFELSDGRIVDGTSLQTDIRGNKVPIGVGPDGKPITIKRQLSPDEAAQYAMQYVFPAAASAVMGGKRQGQQPVQTGGEQTLKIQHYNQAVSSDRKSGKSDDYIREQLEITKQNQPQDAPAIDAVLSTLSKGKQTNTQINKAGGKLGDLKKQARKVFE